MRFEARLRKLEAHVDQAAEPGEGLSALLAFARQHPCEPGEACDLEASSGLVRLLHEARQWLAAERPS